MTNTKGATLGKMALGLKVQSVNGGKLSLGKIITRETIGKILSAIILLIGYMMAGFTQKKQALHDKLAGSVVVYKTDETGSPKHVGKIVLIALIPIIILVAIAVVGILSSVVLVSLNVARQKGADAQVKSVLMQMRTEAEVYYGQNNTYSTTHSCASGMFADPSFTQITSGLKSSTAPTCYAEGSNYAISTPLSTAGQDYCVDSSAFSGNGMATDDGSKASCLAEATSSAAQNLLSSQLQNSQTPTAVTKTNYSYIIPAGWQTVTANASDVEAVDREKKYAFSVQATPLSPQLMYASSIVDVMSADTVKSAIMSESPTIVVDSVNKTTVGGEKAFVTDSHQVPSMSSQSIQQAMVQYNVFHKGSAYTLVFIAPYDSRASAATDIQSIINSFAFKQ
jgi:type II secretory pathway pseudopilin PulG